MSNKKTLHLRTNIKDNKPSSVILEHGAIAINYHKESPTIFIKDSEDNLVEFKDKNYFENIITENELVVSTALTTIKDNIGLNEDGTYTPSEYTSVIKDAKTIVEAAELLDKSLSNIDNVIKTTYSELVSLRDGSKLKPGCWYRIIDYVTTTSQENTQSAGHQFDILVLATDVNTLSEESRIIKHEGDTYFDNCNLASWKAWYCLDNDENRFSWACPQNGKLETIIATDVTYDTPLVETLNRIPSDDIIINDIEFYCYRGGNGPFIEVFFRDKNPTTSSIIYDCDGNFNTKITIEIITTNVSEGRGVIYRMIDEKNNDCPYDFKNIKFLPHDELTSGSGGSGSASNISVGEFDSEMTDVISEENIEELTELLEVSEIKYYYTFDLSGEYDYSLNESCYNNVIKKYVDGGIRKLNCIVFKNISSISQTFGNSFDINCNNMTFGDNCSYNIFNSGCYNNSFGDTCLNNTFGNNCYGNSFGSDCYSNSFGNDCSQNIFISSCLNNTFGNNCYGNSFGESCLNNMFGNSCGYNSFGNSYSFNSFGSDCYSNSFGASCNYNSLGNNCNNNSFGSDCYSNSFGDSCSYNSFTMSDSTDSEQRSYCYNNIIENGVSYINLYNISTGSDFYKLQNVTVCQGMSGTAELYNFVEIPVLNAEYQIKVAKNTNGDIKVYCEADLIN